tara:strand:+ start:5409 stop:6200 length:792 start_codon:yes stop_codon:yes gene_type:complete
MASATATVETLTAEVRVLMVGKRQVTMSVFRQLDTVDWNESETLELFGRVRETRKDMKDLIHVIGKVKDTGVLVRSFIDPTWWMYGRNPKFLISYKPGTSRYSTDHYVPYTEALREMYLDLVLPVRYHYDMSQSQRDKIERKMDASKGILKKLEEAKEEAYDKVYNHDKVPIPRSVSDRDEDYDAYMEAAREALEKARRKFARQEKVVDNREKRLKATESEEYINDVLYELHEAQTEIEKIKFSKALRSEWEKLPLIVLAGLN